MDLSMPERFAFLEAHKDWVIPTMTGRVEKRLASTLAEARSLYDAAAPHLESILAYLDQYEIRDLRPPEQNLLNLTLSLAEIATCVEFYNSMNVPKGVEHSRFPLVDPTNIW